MCTNDAVTSVGSGAAPLFRSTTPRSDRNRRFTPFHRGDESNSQLHPRTSPFLMDGSPRASLPPFPPREERSGSRLVLSEVAKKPATPRAPREVPFEWLTKAAKDSAAKPSPRRRRSKPGDTASNTPATLGVAARVTQRALTKAADKGQASVEVERILRGTMVDIVCSDRWTKSARMWEDMQQARRQRQEAQRQAVVDPNAWRKWYGHYAGANAVEPGGAQQSIQELRALRLRKAAAQRRAQQRLERLVASQAGSSSIGDGATSVAWTSSPSLEKYDLETQERRLQTSPFLSPPQPSHRTGSSSARLPRSSSPRAWEGAVSASASAARPASRSPALTKG